jgi:hypothetical protein
MSASPMPFDFNASLFHQVISQRISFLEMTHEQAMCSRSSSQTSKIHLCWSSIIKGLMKPLLIVKTQVVPQPFPCLTGTGLIFDVHLLVFNGSPQAFSKNIVQSSSFAIHADLYIDS